MSLLTEDLPKSLIIEGEECPIRTDLKTWLKFSQLVDNENIFKALPEMLQLVFFKLPPKLEGAIYAMLDFYSGIKTEHIEKEKGTTKKALFDFEYDAELIYAAFMQQYGIDLSESNMHWWKFRALVYGLAEDTHFSKVIHFRGVDLNEIKDKEQKAFYRRMKAVYKLPDNRSEQAKEECINAVMESVF